MWSSQVTDAIAPDYSRIIKEPRDLGMIRKKISAILNNSSSNNNNSNKTSILAYRSISEFDGDIQLMLNNCILYNGQLSPYATVSRSRSLYIDSLEYILYLNSFIDNNFTLLCLMKAQCCYYYLCLDCS